MIVVCPECDSRYNIKAEVISVDGRVLKCTNCQHDWFHDGVSLHDILDEDEDDYGGDVSSDEDYDDDLGVRLDDIEEALEDELLDDDLYEDSGEIDIGFSEEDSQTEDSDSGIENQNPAEEGFAAILDKVGADTLEPKAGKPEKENKNKKWKARNDTKATGNVFSGVFVGLVAFLILFAGLLVFKDRVMASAPITGYLYSSLGFKIPVVGEGLVFDRVEITWDGAKLMAQGQIINLLTEDSIVPMIELSFMSERDEVLDKGVFSSGVKNVLGEDSFPFQYELQATSGIKEGTKSVTLSFIPIDD